MVDTRILVTVQCLSVLACLSGLATALYPQKTLGNSAQRFYSHGAVAADTPTCSQVAADVLRDFGSVVDAAVAGLFCNGVMDAPHMGLGGGSIMTIYERPNSGGPKEMVSIDSDIRSPLWITDASMIQHWNLKASVSKNEKIAVPGEVAGSWWAWQRFGKLPWKRLVEPSIRLAREGFKVSPFLGKVMTGDWETVLKQPGLDFYKRYYANGTARPIKEGEWIQDEALAQTLEIIAEEGAPSFFTGRLSELILEDLKEYGARITKEDLATYQVRVLDTVATSVGDRNQYTVHSPGFPSYGPVNTFILRVFHAYNMTAEFLSTAEGIALFYHRFAELNKFLYGIQNCFGDGIDTMPQCYGVERELLTGTTFLNAVLDAIDDNGQTTPENYYSVLGQNRDIQPDDQGTSHLSVVSRDGSSVSVTSTIANVYGAGIKGTKTGILFNDRVSTYGRDLNQKTAKDVRPGSSGYTRRAPTIVTDESGRTVLSIGSSGGSRITGGIIEALYLHLEQNVSLQEAIDYPNLAEAGKTTAFQFLCDPFDSEVLAELAKRGQHFTAYTDYKYPKLYSAVTQGVSLVNCYRGDGTSVSTNAACIEAVSDFRKGGVPDGY